MTTPEQIDELVARAAKIASIGGGLLSNASLLKKAAAALTADVPDPVPDPVPHVTLAGCSFGGNTDPSPIETLAGKPLGVWRLYFQASEVAKAVTACQTARSIGRGVVWASFKLPTSWADMSTGAGDVWLTDLCDRLSATGQPVWLCLHHEPEGDAPIADYVAMQRHCLPLMTRPGIKRSIILTGYPQCFNSTGQPDQTGPYALPNVWPGDGLVDILGVDPYLMWGAVDNGKTITSWTDPAAAYFPVFSAWAKAHGCEWAVAETGITDAAYTTPPAGKDGPGWMAAQYAAAKDLDASAWCYFDSTLNSRGTWTTGNLPAKRQALADVIAS